MPTLKNRVCSLSATVRRLTLAAAMSALCTLAVANPPCPSDLDGDGMVSTSDLSMVLLDIGACPADPPTINSVMPNSGPTSGGTTITILGVALTGTTAVSVNGNAATSVTVVNDNFVTAVTPPGAAGPAWVQLTTATGTATISGAFTYTTWCTVLEQIPNADVVPDATLRDAIIATNLPWRVRDTRTGIEMVLIPPGTFTMGCSESFLYLCDSSGNESPNHQVTLTHAFYLSRTEVTQAQWQASLGSNPSFFTGDSSRPVEQVSWVDVQPFLVLNGFRLPSEAEWEYAYRAGTSTAFHGMPGSLNGTNYDTLLGVIAWFDGNSGGETHPVAGKAANGLGLYDMSGNVWEWCQDYYSRYFPFGSETDPIAAMSVFYGDVHLIRGGSFYNNSFFCRASYRRSLSPDMRFNSLGFRVARNP